VRKEYPAAIFDGHAWTIHSTRTPTTKLSSHRIPGSLANLASEIRKGVMVSALSYIKKGDLDDSRLNLTERADASMWELKKSSPPDLTIPLDRAHNDHMRSTHRDYLGYRRTDPTRQGLRERWIDKEPTTTNDHLLVGEEVSHRDTKGAAFDIALHETWGRRSHDEHTLLSGSERELAKKQAFIHIREIERAIRVSERARYRAE
jgi:hypothetical protein